MADKPISFIDDLDLDQGPEPEAGPSPPVHGLVVSARMTEAEFEVYAAELNAMAKAKTMPEIIFESEGD